MSLLINILKSPAVPVIGGFILVLIILKFSGTFNAVMYSIKNPVKGYNSGFHVMKDGETNPNAAPLVYKPIAPETLAKLSPETQKFYAEIDKMIVQNSISNCAGKDSSNVKRDCLTEQLLFVEDLLSSESNPEKTLKYMKEKQRILEEMASLE